MARLGIWVFGRKTSEGRCPLISSVQALLAWVVPVHVDFAQLAEVMFAGFLQCESPPASHTPSHCLLASCTLRTGVTVCNPPLRTGELGSAALRVDISVNYLEFFCVEDLSLPISLLSNFFKSIWTHGYLFYSFGYSPTLCYLLFRLLPFWPLKALQLAPVSF